MTALCFLCGLYLQGGLAVMSQPGAAAGAGHTYWLADINRVENPHGTIEIGWTSPAWRGLELEVAFRHISSIGPTQDHGQNTAELRGRWRPFKP